VAFSWRSEDELGGVLDGANVGGKQRRKPRRIATRHPTLGADAINARMPPSGSETLRVTRGIVVVDKAEIKFSFLIKF